MGNANVVGHIHRLIVFDLDGTLIDSRADLADAANALIVERGGRPLPEGAIARMVGEGAAVLVRRALSAAALPLEPHSVDRFLALYDDRLLHATRPYPGILGTLDALSNASTLAVLTNKPIAPTRKLLDAFGLASFFACAIGGDGPFPRKPDPAALFHLMAEHGSAPHSTVLVGDSRIDLETARAAGTRICLARYGFGYEGVVAASLRGDDGVAGTPAEIPGVIETLLDRTSGIS